MLNGRRSWVGKHETGVSVDEVRRAQQMRSGTSETTGSIDTASTPGRSVRPRNFNRVRA
jgi:hypothetical protein